MIGQPLQKINHVALADDYNRLVEVIRPLQNLTFGEGINGMISTTGIAISGGPARPAPFKHPFKVTQTNLEDGSDAVNVQYGRMYWTDTSEPSAFVVTEVAGGEGFTLDTGLDVDVTGVTDDYIVIAFQDFVAPATYPTEATICLESALPTDYTVVQKIAHVTQATPGAIIIEQIQTSDYTCFVGPAKPVPFTIAKFGDDTVIWIPPNSLIINDVDWSFYITNLSNGTPVLDDWYTYNPNVPWLNIEYSSTNGCTLGSGFGKVIAVSNDATALGTGYTSYRISQGTSPLMHGSIILDLIRPDSGDLVSANASLYKSIAVQGLDTGIAADNADRTIEIHGFKLGQAPSGAMDESDPTYSHKVAVRELNTGTGVAEVRWADIADVGGSTFTHPWQAIVTAYGDGNGDTFSLQIGRVYEADTYNSGQSTPTTLVPFCFRELTSYDSYVPGSVISLTAPTSVDVLCITVIQNSDTSIADTYHLEWESTTSKCIFARIAVYTPGSGVMGTFEQIQMGSAWRSVQQVWAFALGTFSGNRAIHIPPNSIWVNGTNFTTSTALTPAGPTDWYILPNGILYAYVLMYNVDGEYGKVYSVDVAATAPAHDGEIITIPIADNQNSGGGICFGLVNGAICLDIVRPDARTDTNNVYKSIAEFAAVENKTLGLQGFITPDLPTDPTLDSDGISHHIAMRENDGQGHVTLKWWAFENLEAAIEDVVTEQVGAIDWSSIFSSYWDTWYDDPAQTRKFWELGADHTIAYGSAIGKDAATPVIDLTNQTLLYGSGTWLAAVDFFPTTDAAFNLGCSDRRWNQGRFNEIYTESIGSGSSSVMLIRNDVSAQGCNLGMPNGCHFGCAFINSIETANLYAGAGSSAITVWGDIFGTGGCCLGYSASQGFGYLHLNSTGKVYINDIKVLDAQQAAVADSTDTTDVAVQLNLALAALRAHGLIAT